MTKASSVGWILICWCCVIGCGKNDSVEPTTSTPASEFDGGLSESTDDSLKTSSPNYAELFEAIVQGSLPDMTDQQDAAGWKALGRVTHFDETENKAFVEFLQQKLTDKSPFVRMKAAFNVALIRTELGIADQNKDLIPIFVDLLHHDDLMVRKFSLIDMDPLVGKSGLGEELRPLVQPLIDTLQDSLTTYISITSLGAIGPTAKEAIPFIRKAAERENDKYVDEASDEAIRKIEGGDK